MITHKNIHIVKNKISPFKQTHFVLPNKYFACSIGIFIFLCSLHTSDKITLSVYIHVALHSMHAEVQETVISF